MNPAVVLRSEVALYPVINPELAMARGSVLSQPGREKKGVLRPDENETLLVRRI